MEDVGQHGSGEEYADFDHDDDGDESHGGDDDDEEDAVPSRQRNVSSNREGRAVESPAAGNRHPVRVSVKNVLARRTEANSEGKRSKGQKPTIQEVSLLYYIYRLKMAEHSTQEEINNNNELSEPKPQRRRQMRVHLAAKKVFELLKLNVISASTVSRYMKKDFLPPTRDRNYSSAAWKKRMSAWHKCCDKWMKSGRLDYAKAEGLAASLGTPIGSCIRTEFPPRLCGVVNDSLQDSGNSNFSDDRAEAEGEQS